MDKKNRNPIIRVLPQTRKKLKVIAAYYDETMQEATERIAEHELKWIEQQMVLKANQAEVEQAQKERQQREKGV